MPGRKRKARHARADEQQRRLEAMRAEAAARKPGRTLDDYWTPAEIHGNLYVLLHLSEWHASQYGSPETFN